jgi:hypothetical protein
MLPIVQTIKLKVSLKNTTQIVKSEYVGTYLALVQLTIESRNIELFYNHFLKY